MPKQVIRVETSAEISSGMLSRLFGIQRSEAKLAPTTTVASKAAEMLPRSHQGRWGVVMSLDAEVLTTGAFCLIVETLMECLLACDQPTG